jgi:hypothetical protein
MPHFLESTLTIPASKGGAYTRDLDGQIFLKKNKKLKGKTKKNKIRR